MVVNADQFVANANKAHSNDPGTCLKTVRTWAGIAAVYPDASTAWRNVKDKHTDRNPPKGSAVYWTGGSHGYGHIVTSLGGQKIRSTDCTYGGVVSTVDLGWVERAWGLKYAGWSWEINNVTIPHEGGGSEADDMQQSDSIGKWSPDDGATGDTTIGKTLNQARGYSEDTYERVKVLENKVADLTKTVNQIWNAVKG